MRVHSLKLGVLLVILATLPLSAAELPEGFRLEPVFGGLTDPSAITATSGGMMLITERTTGNVRAVKGGVLQPGALCNVGVSVAGDGGLLGIAVHPQFESNGWLYLYYTDAGSQVNKVTRLTVGPAGCGLALDVLADLGAGPGFLRNGGGMGFGADGKLYVATGDMETDANGQDDQTLAGKVLRINDDGTIPADNPTGGSAIYALGVRDGRALAMNPAGMVYAVDQGDTADPDEVNYVPAGGNLGWSVESGSGGVLDEPLAEWAPSVGLSGATVYGGGLFPAAAGDGIDNDRDGFGPDGFPGRIRKDDNGLGECVGGTNNTGTCATNADCPPRPGEISFCWVADEIAEYCPGGSPLNDDVCGNTGGAGVDEPDESFSNTIFAASDTSIERTVPTGAGLDEPSSYQTFLDSSALPDCPTGWTGLLAAGDGMLYALATNGGGAAGTLYRVVYDAQPGPREVSPPGSAFPLQVQKGGADTEVVLLWEDLRDDAKQPRDNGVDPLAGDREYTVWRGTLGSFASHTPLAGFDATAGTAVNDALRTATVDSVPGADEYFLVSGRGDNLEGTLGSGAAGERTGYTVTDLCDNIGFHQAPGWALWTCGRDFSLNDEYGVLRTLSDYRGQVVVFDFSGVWCGPCHAEANLQEQLYQDYKDRGVHMITMLFDEDSSSTDWDGRPTEAECRQWGNRPDPFMDHSFSCWADPCPVAPCSGSDTSQQSWWRYNAHGALPTNVILDRGMRVIYTGAGFAETTIRDKLTALVGAGDTCVH